MSISFYSLWHSLKFRLFSALKFYWQYKPNRLYFLIIFLMQLLLFYFSYQIFKAIGDDLFVSHYNVDFGIDGIGSASKVFRVPIISSIIFIVNTLLIIAVYRRDSFKFLAHAANLSSLLISFLAGLALMSLYLINFIA